MEIHLAIAFDENYLSPFCALLASIIDHRSNKKVHIHCIATGLKDDCLSKLEQYASTNSTYLHFYNVDTTIVSNLVLKDKWTSAVYYRLLFPGLVPTEVKRLLYLDTDMLIVGSLDALYFQDLNGKPVGAVYDNYVVTQPLIGIDRPGEYFNSGMLLIDVDLWKSLQISEKALQYLNEFPNNIKFVDQCALNAVLKKQWHILPYRFNCLYSYIPEYLPKSKRVEFLNDIVILHFTLHRPWKMLSKNPFNHIYSYYLNKSPLKFNKRVTDFSVNKLPAFFKLHFIKFYHNNAVLKYVWRRFKAFHV